MVQTASNVRIDKPLAAGAIWVAPVGSPIPTDPSAPLDASFLCAGYLLKGGVTNANDRSSTNIVAYGGDIVAVASSDDVSTFAFTLIETNDVSMGMYRGKSNVSTTGNVRTVKYNSKDLDHYAMVIELLSTSGLKRRIVGGDSQVTQRGNIVYQDEDASAMPVTMTCFPDSNGNKALEYEQLVAAVVPVINSVGDHDGTPTTLAVAGGSLFTILGSGFTGTTAVSIGGNAVAAANYSVVSDNRIEGIAPAHAAGVVAVIVTNATGASTTGTTAATYA